MNKETIRDKINKSNIEKSIKKDFKELSKRHSIMIEDIQERCCRLAQMERDDKQISLIGIVMCNILQGFDSKEEMNIVIDIQKRAIEAYWKRNDIPQKK